MSKSVKKPVSLRRAGRSQLPGSRCMLAAGIALAAAGSLPTHAQDSEEEISLDTLQIEDRTADTNPYAEPGAPYKAKTSGDLRRVKPIAETPATIEVLTQTQVKESGRSDLRGILAAQPGITLGTGENGNAFGDRYVIRGQEARSDVFVDGIRDPGMTTRESFAVEQIEITKGPSATFAGRGSSGGAVNSITKQASTDYNFNKAEAGLGTDSYQRYTLDSNIKINEDAAVRANLLYADRDVPDREPASRERTGVALSGALQATEKLKVVADYYYLNAEDKPDLGTYINRDTGKPVKDVPVYLQDQDFLESEVEVFTGRVNYDFSDSLRLQNLTRYGTTDNGYVVTGMQGGTRAVDTTVVDEETGEETIIPGDPIAPGAATQTLSTHQGWQEVDYFVNQSNLFFETELGGMEHNFVFSLEYSDLSVTNGVYNVENLGTSNCRVSGRRGISDSYCALDGDGNLVSNLNSLLGRNISRGSVDSDYSVETVSVALMDVIDINDKLALHLGVRIDDYDYENDVTRGGETTNWAYSDTLWNGHVGAVYKITENGNVYFNYSTATNINGGESDVGASCGYGGLCGAVEIVEDSEPEKVQNIELGTKWNILDEKLLATAAVFQITKSDIMESESGRDYVAEGFLNTGEHEIDGIEVSLAGNLTPKLSTLFGVAIMNAEITESYSEDNLGKTLPNFADKSAFLQLRYQATDKFSFGGIASYSSEVFTGQPDTAANEELGVPSYTVYDVFASYAFTDKLKARLNVGNVTDKDYYFTAYRSGAFTYLGDARNAQLAVSYEF